MTETMTETTIVKDGNEASWLGRIRLDAAQLIAGWFNPLTGQGDPEKDKSAAAMWAPGVLMEAHTLADLFTFNALARAICTSLPEWSMRNGWDLTLDQDAVKSQQIESALRAKADDLGAGEKLLRGAVWGQTFGGGLVLVGAEDGRETKEPLDEANIRSIRWLRVVPRHRARVHSVYDDPRRAGFGETAVYEVRELGANSWTTQHYHESRVILFPGPTTDDEMRLRNGGWDQSILDVVVGALRKHDGMWDDVGAMTKDASQGVWTIKGLAQAASSGMAEHIQARIRLADLARSIFGTILLDADKEDFKYVERGFAGVSDLLGQSAVRTAGAAQQPVTVLMGQSPAGLNATGESDLELWYARCEAYQTGIAVSRVERFVRLLMLAKDGPLQGKEPEAWAVKMRDPRKLPPMKRKEFEARQAQIDSAMIAAKVLTPEEVAISRYTAEGWSEVTQIALGWRRDFLKKMKETIDVRAVDIFEGMLNRWLAVSPEGVQATNPAAALVEPSGSEADPNGGLSPITPPPPGARSDRADLIGALALGGQLALAGGLPRGDARDGCMIAFRLPAALAADLALEGGEPPESLHLTLAYLGRTSVLDADALERAAGVVQSFALRSRPLEALVGGLGRFTASRTTDGLDVLVALVDAPGLGAMRAELVAELDRARVPVSKVHDFMPHVTLAYIPSRAALPIQSIATRSWVVGALDWYVGGKRRRYTLEGRG